MPERVQITSALATKMRKAREAQSISQSELGRRGKVPRARIKRLECHELSSIDAHEYGRLTVALGMTKQAVKKKAVKKKSVADKKKMRVRAARAVLEQHGLLEVTLGELLRG